MLSTMAVGMLRTAGIFVLTLLGSLPLGMIVALLRKSRFAVVRGIIRVYISVMRGTPLMLQLLVWYFGPFYLFGWNIGGWRFPALIVGFVLNYAAYFAEIYRGGIESISAGQYEAAEVLGYTKTQTFLRIILPQVIKRIMPSVTNEVITLVKDTSLAFTLAYQEVFPSPNRSRLRRPLSCRSSSRVFSTSSPTMWWLSEWNALKKHWIITNKAVTT